MAFDPFAEERGASAPFDPFATDTAPAKKQNKGLIADIGTDLKRGVQQLPGAITGLADIAVGGISGKPLISNLADRAGEATGFQPAKWAKSAEAEYSPSRQAGRAEVDAAWENGTASDIAGAYLKNPMNIVGSVAESLPSMIAGGLAGRAALGIGAKAVSAGAGGVGPALPGIIARTVGTGLAPAVGAGIGEGGIMAGQAMANSLDAGVDPRTAAGYAGATGLVGGALGALGGKVAQRFGVVDPETLIAGGIGRQGSNATGLAAAKEVGKRMAGGAISEGLFEELPQSVFEQGFQNLAQDKPLTEGMARAGVEGALAGSFMGGAFNAIPGGRYAESKINAQTKPQDKQQPIAGLLPSPTYTGTPGEQIVAADAERQAAIDAADKNAADLYAMRDAFEAARQNVTLVADPVPVQQRIDAMLGLDTERMDKKGRALYEKDLAAAFNEPIGITHDANQREVPFTMGEYLDAQVKADDAVRARERIPAQTANQQASSRLTQLADEEAQQHAAITQDLVRSAAQGGALSKAALTGIQTGATQMPVHPERAAIEQQMLADEAAQAELAPIERLMRTRSDEEVQRVADNPKANPKMRQVAIADLQRRMATKAQPTTTSPLQQTATQLNMPAQNGIKQLQAQLEQTEPFTEQSSALTNQLQSAVTQDAQSALNAGEMPVYKVTDHVSVAIHPSAQNPGMVQVTRYTKDGVIGDSQYNNVDDAVRQEGLTHKPRIASNEAVAVIEKSIQAESEYQQRKSAAPVPNADAGIGVGGITRKRSIENWTADELQARLNRADAGESPLQPESRQKIEAELAKRPARKAPINHGLSVGKAPNSAAPVTVRNGVIFIGDEPAVNYDTEQDITIANDATPRQIVDALKSAGAIATSQRFYGLPAEPKAEKQKTDRRQIDATKDTLFQAIAKLGGMDTQELTSNGFDPKDITYETAAKVSKKTGKLGKKSRLPLSFGFNMPLHKKGGMSFDGVLEELKQHGYFPEDATKNDAIEAFRRELGGDAVMTPDAAMQQAEMQAEQEANDAIGYDDLSDREKALVDFHAENIYDEDNQIEAFKRGMKRDGATEDEINEAIKQTFGAQETGNNDSGGTPQGTGETRDAQGADDGRQDGEVQEGAEPDWLTGQTNEQAAAELARQQAAKDKEAADKKAAEDKAKADAEANDFRLAGSDRAADVAVAGGQHDIFAQAPKPERGEVGASLTKAERSATLKTLIDVYRKNRAPKEFKGLDSNGNERYGYAHSPEFFVKSDITGSMVRYYVTLPDGRVAHPTELFSDYTQANIDAALQKEIDAEREQERNNNSERERLLSLTAPTINEANGKFNNAQRFAEDRDSIVPALLTNGELYLRSRPENADKAASLLGEGWRVEAQQEVKPAPAKYAGPADVSSRSGQMELANRAGTIATLKAMNEQLRKIAPDEAWADSNIDDAQNLDALRDQISQALVDANRGKPDVNPLRKELEELSGQELKDVFSKLNLAGKLMAYEERISALLMEDAAEVRAAISAVTGNPSESTAQPVKATTEAKAVEPAAVDAKKEAETDDRVPKQYNTMAAIDSAIEGFYDGSISLDDYKAAFNGLMANKDAILAELGKLTKDQLLRRVGKKMYGGSETKPEIVTRTFDAIREAFALRRSYGRNSWTMGPGQYEKYQADNLAALTELVNSSTAEDLKAFADEIGKTRAARQEKIEAAKDPKTIEDFENAIRLKRAEGLDLNAARMSLTPEQRAEYDRLRGTESRNQRKARADQQKTDVRVAAQTTDGQVVETKHTKTGEPLFVVKAAERVDRDVYNQWNATAKRMGGYYSSFRGNGAVPGFQFKTRENADAFLAFIGGNAEAAKEVVQERRDAFADDKSQSAVERLNEMADRMEDRADESLGRERKANTERRARFAASAENAANAEKAMAKTMRRIAEAISSGTAQFIDRIRQKAQVEYLSAVLRTAKDNEIRSKYPAYADQEKRRGEAPTIETADYAEFPAYTMMRSDLANLARKLVTLPNMKMLGQRILKIADDTSDAYNAFAKDNLLAVSRFGKSDGSGFATFSTVKDAERSIEISDLGAVAVPLQIKRGEYRIVLSPSEAIKRGVWKGDDRKITLSPDLGAEVVDKLGRLNRRAGARRGMDAPPEAPWQFESAYNNRKRLEAMGIETTWEYRALLREFAGLKEEPKEREKIKEMERAMIGRKNDGLDFFPTPEETAKAMIDAAEISEGMSVLEPSAGMGHIAEQIRGYGVDPDVIEFNSDRRELLEAKGFNVVGSDFMDMTPRSFMFGDVFRAPDGTTGVMRGSGNLGSGRVRLLNDQGEQLGYFDRDALDPVEKRGYESGYDRIIMNPPFSGRRDAEHVQHAYSLLRPGGRLVAIMGEGVFFGQDKKAQGFRDWLEEVGGTSEKLDEGTFMDPSLPVNTATNARLVVIEKPESDKGSDRYSKSDNSEQVVAITRQQAESRIKSILGDKLGKVLIDSGIVTFTNKGNEYQGATYKDGSIVLNLDALSADNFDGVLLHEGMHSTIRDIVGEATYAKLMKQLENMHAMGKGAQWVKDANAAIPSDTKAEHRTEELAAYAIEQYVNGAKQPNIITRWVESLLSALRTAIIRKLPFGKLKSWAINNLQPQDLANLAIAGLKAKARGQLQAQGREATAFSKINQTDTPAFKKWFGSSKVVDADGKPLVVYHGTNADFTSFDAGRLGEKTGGADALGGFFFAENPDAADQFTWANGEKSGSIMPVYLAIKNPARGVTRLDGSNGRAAAREIEAAKAAGHDGIVFDSDMLGNNGDTWVAFRPEQIKSAIGNNGNFDGTNPDIRYSRAQIIGDSGRQYDQTQRQFFKNVGRDIDKKNLVERTTEYLKNDFWKKMAVGIVDQFRGLRDLGDNGQAYMLARLSKGTAGAFDALLHHGKLSIRDGVYDADTSGGFIDRLGTPLHGELDDFLWYVAANRAEGLSKVDRENLFTPADIAAGKSLAKGQTNFDYTIQTGPQKGTTTRNRTLIYADANRVFNEFQKNTLDMAEQSGLIDSASRKLWESEFYVPFYRVSEEDGEFIGAKMGKALVRQQAFKKLKGGTDKLNSDLLSNTLLNFSHLIEASAKNRAAKASLAAAEQIGVAERVAPDMASYTASNGSMLPPGTKGTVWFQENGKKVEYKVTDPFVMTAITSLEYAGMRNGVMDVMTKFKHWLTIGVTASPAFKVRNLIRDSIQSIGASDLSYNPIKNIAEGYKQTKRDSQEYVSALASGGLIRFGTMLEGSESSRVRQLVKSGVKDSTILNSENKWRAFYDQYLDPAVSAYNELGNRSEEINRAALYNQLIKQGKSHAEAALLARDLMDFSMQGSFNTIRFLTQVVPFMNARLQGMYKLGRAAKDNPRKLAVVTGAVALASIALMLAYGDDDDWKRREDWDRDGFWWFKMGGIEFRIPKPFEVGAIGSLAERGLELMIDDEMTGERFRRVVNSLVMNNLSMNPLPQAFKPILDLYANKDSFTGRPIESMGMQRLDPTERFNSNTSMIARGMSNASFGALSPVQIDHLARAYFGWLGSFVIGGADMAFRGMSDQPTKPALDYFKFGTQGILKEAGTGSSRYVTQVYEQAKELEQAHATYRQMIKDGRIDEAKDYAADNQDKMIRYRQVEAVKKVESNLNERIRKIERSDMDSGEKKDAIALINKQKEQVAKRIAAGAS